MTPLTEKITAFNRFEKIVSRSCVIWLVLAVPMVYDLIKQTAPSESVAHHFFLALLGLILFCSHFGLALRYCDLELVKLTRNHLISLGYTPIENTYNLYQKEDKKFKQITTYHRRGGRLVVNQINIQELPSVVNLYTAD